MTAKMRLTMKKEPKKTSTHMNKAAMTGFSVFIRLYIVKAQLSFVRI
jgi:hypothetical protein